MLKGFLATMAEKTGDWKWYVYMIVWEPITSSGDNVMTALLQPCIDCLINYTTY